MEKGAKCKMNSIQVDRKEKEEEKLKVPMKERVSFRRRKKKERRVLISSIKER